MGARGREHVLDMLSFVLRDPRVVEPGNLLVFAKMTMQDRCPGPVQSGNEEKMLVGDVRSGRELADLCSDAEPVSSQRYWEELHLERARLRSLKGSPPSRKADFAIKQAA
jgi:hypothetical protein